MNSVFLSKLVVLIVCVMVVSCSKDEVRPNEANNNISLGETLFFELDENPANGMEMGVIPAIDSSMSLTYGLTLPDPIGALEVDLQSGVIRVLDSVLFNFEARDIIRATGIVSDGDHSVNHPIEIEIRDLYERYSYIGSIRLTTQEEVNDFGEENHWGVSGTFTLNSSSRDPIVDLTPLSQIQAVGTLSLLNIHQRSIELNRLEWVENDLKITGCNDLLELGNLNIPHIGGSLIIRQNQDLRSLAGMGIDYLGGDLIVTDNDRLESLEGIVQDRIEGDLQIARNRGMFEISGLEDLNYVGGDFRIANMLYLEDLNGLDALATIAGGLSIQDNSQLHDYCALNELIQSNGLEGSYLVSGNEYNPSIQQLLDGDCNY